jgi:hypothetical protein
MSRMNKKTPETRTQETKFNARDRRRFRTAELSYEEIERIAKSKVPPGHEHLNELLKDRKP